MTTMTTITITSGPLQGVKLERVERRWGRARTLLGGLAAGRWSRHRRPQRSKARSN